MQAKTKVLVNTIVLYAKAVINTLIALVSVPLILKALGQSDYGLFNLVAGVIALLSFLNASMTVSTQRFMSVAMGEGNSEKLNLIYNTSFSLHVIIGIFVIFLFESFAPIVFSGFLKIEPDRIQAAVTVYQILIVSTFCTIMSVPLNAVLNANENLIVFAFLHILEALLKLLLAIILLYCPFDKLIFYSIGIALITVGVYFLKFVYIIRKYHNLNLHPKLYFDKTLFKEMFGFAGWNTFGSIALLGRNQGVAMIMNVFYGTIINAAYGIANQINGQMSYISSTLQQAINPQLMKSEGMSDRLRLIRISYISCKYSVLAICLPAIPLIIEMAYVLKLWLSDTPKFTVIFSQLILMLTIVAQYSSGIQSSIQSVGRIRPYFFTVSSILLLNIPVAYCLLENGFPPPYAIVCFIFTEFLSLITRLLFARKYVGISLRDYFSKVVLKTVVPMFSAAIPVCLIHILMPESFLRLLSVCMLYAAIYLVIVWLFAFNKSERDYFIKLIPFKRKRSNVG